MSPLSSHEFPPLIAAKSLDFKGNPKALLIFRDKICHKCNLATPTVRTGSTMYSGKFTQYYGWYIRQQYLHFGIGQNGVYLKDKCPDEFTDLLIQLTQAENAGLKERMKLNELVNSPKRNNIADNEITYWSNVKMKEAKSFDHYEKEIRKLYRKLANRIENIVRQDFGFRNVGEGCIGESILCKIVERLSPDKQVIRHYRPDWLKGLELDIYIPEIKLAFEYQGQQHYYPIKAWGGKIGLDKIRERDQLKRNICADIGIQLITVDFSEPLTENHIDWLVKSKNGI